MWEPSTVGLRFNCFSVLVREFQESVSPIKRSRVTATASDWYSSRSGIWWHETRGASNAHRRHSGDSEPYLEKVEASGQTGLIANMNRSRPRVAISSSQLWIAAHMPK